MADELQYYGDPSSDTGLTVIARVYDNTGTLVGSDVTTAEVGSLAIYQGDMPTAGAGSYAVRFFNGTTMLGQGIIQWDGSAEVTEQTLNAQVTALNDFDPASDTVARVTLVDTTTANTDMRGTDGANTTAPDDTAVLNAISGLNDLSSADVTAAIPSEIDANIIKVNNVTIDGVGTKDNPFGP
jgi:hypothetical protein